MFKRQQPDSGAEPTAEYRAVYERAQQLMTEGAPLFHCSIFVGDQALGIMHVKFATKHPVDSLLAAVESLGWRLEQMNHVWVPFAAVRAAGPVAGMQGSLLGQYLFRNTRAGAGQPQ